MGLVLDKSINDFCSRYEIDSAATDSSTIFELYSASAILPQYYRAETITPDLLRDINTGGGNDWGIDNFIIKINGAIVSTLEEAEDLFSKNRYLEVTFVLIQAKTSKNFDSKEFGAIIDGAENVFIGMDAPEIRPKKNEKIELFNSIVEFVYGQSPYFKDAKDPELHIYYVYQGAYTEVSEANSRIEKFKRTVKAKNLFSLVTCDVIDEGRIATLYKKSMVSLQADICVGNDSIMLPAVNNITESYICLVPFSEFRKLITDENGEMLSAVFEDNIRDFQGHNKVNEDMARSIREGDIPLFTMMNNGITVIARTVQQSRKYLHLEEFQIVNGCQTSHVLYEHRNVKGIDELNLVVKFIASDDTAIKNKIIIGNNSQTAVQREQLTALLDSNREIEDYYNAQNKFDRLYYERRSKQYCHNRDIKPGRIITIAKQIQAFVAMFLNEPHKVRGYYGQIIQDFSNSGTPLIDSKKNHPALYYTCGLAWYKLNGLFDANKLNPAFKRLKFHLLYAFRLLAENGNLSKLQKAADVENYCDVICSKLCNPQQCHDIFQQAITLINRTLGREVRAEDRFDATLTQQLYSTIQRAKSGQPLQPPRRQRTEARSVSANEVFSPEHSSPTLKIIGKIDLSQFDKRKK